MILKVFYNELKKILFLIFFSFLAFSISFIPMLVPLSILLTGVVVGAGFIDYSWSRYQMNFKECLGQIKRIFIPFSIFGMIFSGAMAIPFVNLFFLPLGVVVFSVLFTLDFNQLKKS